MNTPNNQEPDSNKQISRRTPKHSNPKNNSKKILFFWGLLLAVIAIVAGTHYGIKRYQAAHRAADSIYSSANIQKARDVSQTLKEGKPICLLLMGTDTGALGRNFKGRTDTMIVAVLNPKKKMMTVVSLPRDAEVAVYGYENQFPSKLNSAYEYGGSAAAVKTVQKYLNVPIDFYATINMGGLENLIDAVGGVKVTPNLTFSYDGYSFTKDKETTMSGKKALAYVRMRYDDPLGDYGRQERQRQVLISLAFKASKLTSLLNDNFLNTISKQMTTDLSFNELLVLGTKYRVATHGMTSDHLQGETQMVDGQSFEIPTTQEKQRITDILRKALGLSKATTGSTLSSSDHIDTK